MKIENLDEARRLGCLRDLLLSMIRHLSKENKERRIRVHSSYRPDDAWDDVSSDDRLIELVEQSVRIRLKEVEQEIAEIE